MLYLLIDCKCKIGKLGVTQKHLRWCTCMVWSICLFRDLHTIAVNPQVFTKMD